MTRLNELLFPCHDELLATMPRSSTAESSSAVPFEWRTLADAVFGDCFTLVGVVILGVAALAAESMLISRVRIPSELPRPTINLPPPTTPFEVQKPPSPHILEARPIQAPRMHALSEAPAFPTDASQENNAEMTAYPPLVPPALPPDDRPGCTAIAGSPAYSTLALSPRTEQPDEHPALRITHTPSIAGRVCADLPKIK